MRPVTISKTLAAASANSIAASQSGTANTALTLTSAVVTLDTQRRVLITSAGNDSGITFAITGTSESGNVITEKLTGGNVAAVGSVNDYLTVTKIVPSGNTAAAVTVGTSSIGSTPWKNASWNMAPFSLEVETVVSGTVTYSLEYTLSKFWEPSNSPLSNGYATNVKTSAVSNATAAAANTFTFPIAGWRLTVSSGTGTVTAEAAQAGYIN